MKLTDRDRSIHTTLVARVRALSLAQIADVYFDGSVATARRRTRLLTAAGVLIKCQQLVRSFEITSPLYCWVPYQPAPNFQQLSRKVTARWLNVPTRSTTVFLAAKRFSGVVGRRSKGRLSHPLQLSHDLGVSQVYLLYVRTSPAEAAEWVGEDSETRRGRRKKQKPDAVLKGEDGCARLAIEFGGIYSADRLHKFHAYCQARSLPYAIW